MKDGYNGYSNWDTWNVVLWVSNDEGLYRSLIAESKWGDVQGEFDTKRAREFFEDIMGGDTPDNVDAKRVDWTEVAEAFTDICSD